MSAPEIRPILPRRTARVFSGRTLLAWRVPPECDAWAADPPEAEALRVRDAVRSRLRGLASALRGATRVAIVVPDATRPCPLKQILPPLLAAVEAARVPRDGITVLIASGLHRPLSAAEIGRHVGGVVARRVRVLAHDAQDAASLRLAGRTDDGVPVVWNRAVVEADAVVTVGAVEPHQYAGYSGGWKTVAIGCAGEDTIRATHSPAMLDRPGVAAGRLEGNPFAEAIRRIGSFARIVFSLQCVVDGRGRTVGLFGGPLEDAFRRAVRMGRSLFEIRSASVFDTVVAGVAAPKDINLYQASRVATAVALAEPPIVRPGGSVVIAARCADGAGRGEAERRFYRAITEGPSPEAVLERAREFGLRGGEQRAYLLARALVRNRIVVVGAPGDLLVAAHMRPARTIEDALRGVRGPVLFVRDGTHAVLRGPAPSRAERRVPHSRPPG